MTDQVNDPLLDGDEETGEKPAAAKTAKSSKTEKPAAAKPVAGKKVARKPHWPEGFEPTGDRVADAKAILDAAPKTQFMIPLESNEKDGAVETVSINGYPYIIKKGHLVTIPVPVANMLANKYRVAMQVANAADAMASQAKADALS